MTGVKRWSSDIARDPSDPPAGLYTQIILMLWCAIVKVGNFLMVKPTELNEPQS